MSLNLRRRRKRDRPSTESHNARNQSELGTANLRELELGPRNWESTLEGAHSGATADLASQAFNIFETLGVRGQRRRETVTVGIPARSVPPGRRARASGAACVATIGGNLSFAGHIRLPLVATSWI